MKVAPFRGRTELVLCSAGRCKEVKSLSRAAMLLNVQARSLGCLFRRRYFSIVGLPCRLQVQGIVLVLLWYKKNFVVWFWSQRLLYVRELMATEMTAAQAVCLEAAG